ncbi:hypothetical protein ACW9KT_19740 [Hymenobacter sp. HD11105]
MEARPSDLPNGEVPPRPQPSTITSDQRPPNRKRKLLTPTKTTADKVDLWVKIAAPLLTVAGLICGVWQYQHQQAFNDAQEFRRKTWEKRLEAYTELGKVAAQLVAAAPDQQRFDSLSSHFDEIYWGKLPLFDNQRVEIKLKAFNDEVQDIKHQEGDSKALKIKGYNLMKECQSSLQDTWYEAVTY